MRLGLPRRGRRAGKIWLYSWWGEDSPGGESAQAHRVSTETYLEMKQHGREGGDRWRIRNVRAYAFLFLLFQAVCALVGL